MTGSDQTVIRSQLALKFIAFLSVVRWYNILLIIFAQYLSAYVLNRSMALSIWSLLADLKLHAIVLASVFSIAGGFIINNFYDFEKDLINRPETTLFNRTLSKQSSLNLYIVFNILTLLIAFSASFRIGIFFTCFMAALWVYSHKLQKMPFIKELAASALSIACFFAVLLHYNRFYTYIFIYGAFYMSLVYSRELVKQFINYNGDLVLNIQSLPVSLGLDKAKSFCVFVMVLSLLGGSGILFYDGLLNRSYFIAFCLFCISISLVLLQNEKYRLINTLYKILLVAGIANILWI